MPGPIVFYELATSAPVDYSIDSKGVTKKFICPSSTYDENAIAAAFTAFVPQSYDTLNLVGIKLEPLGGMTWMCDADYALSPFVLTPGVLGSLGPEVEFDITAGQVHITQSLGTRYRWLATDVVNDGTGPPPNYARGQNLTIGDAALTATPDSPDTWTPTADDIGKILLVSGVTATATGTWTLGSWFVISDVVDGSWVLGTSGSPSPGTPSATGGMWTLVDSLATGFGDNPANTGSAENYQQAIGVQTDSVQGTDIFAPKFEFGISAQVAPLTYGFLNTIRAVCAKVNDAPFKGGDAGETLYLGATGECSPGGVWKVKHRFARGQNLYAVPVSLNPTTGNPDIVIPYKGAWEYLWAAYRKTGDVNNGVILSVPGAAFVEQVYRQADFTQLGIGT